MSLYNLIHGANPATFFILPMLGEKHPDAYPRFRDCFADKENHWIKVYTRVGGNNRGQGYGEEELYKHPNFLSSVDDEFDNTYATYFFSVPEEWIADFDIITSAGNVQNTSKAYQQRVIAVFPKIKDKLEALFTPNNESTS